MPEPLTRAEVLAELTALRRQLLNLLRVVPTPCDANHAADRMGRLVAAQQAFDAIAAAVAGWCVVEGGHDEHPYYEMGQPEPTWCVCYRCGEQRAAGHCQHQWRDVSRIEDGPGHDYACVHCATVGAMPGDGAGVRLRDYRGGAGQGTGHGGVRGTVCGLRANVQRGG